jgi:AraC-like DNA-binding protein
VACVAPLVINTAKFVHQLGATDLKLARIAQLAGFEYQEHLYRLFKQWAKRTPQQYRESFRHGHA